MAPRGYFRPFKNLRYCYFPIVGHDITYDVCEMKE